MSNQQEGQNQDQEAASQDERYAKFPGDDEAAESEDERTRPEPAEGFEAIQWRVAKSLEKLRAEINATATNRSTVSDGGIDS